MIIWVMPIVHTLFDAAAGAPTNGGRRPTVVVAPAAASPELSGRPWRRTFTAQDKLRILAETDRAAETGDIGTILRREASTPLPSPTGAGNATPVPSARWSRASAAARPSKSTRWRPNSLWRSATMPVSRGAWHMLRPSSTSKKSCGVAGHPAGPQRRRALTDAVVALAPDSGMTAAACAALGVSRANVQRRRARLVALPAQPRPRPRPARALTTPQQQ